MRKKLFAAILLTVLFCISQNAISQNIIMGTTPLVSDIDDQVRDFYDPGGSPEQPGANQDPNGFFAENLRDCSRHP